MWPFLGFCQVWKILTELRGSSPATIGSNRLDFEKSNEVEKLCLGFGTRKLMVGGQFGSVGVGVNGPPMGPH